MPGLEKDIHPAIVKVGSSIDPEHNTGEILVGEPLRWDNSQGNFRLNAAQSDIGVTVTIEEQRSFLGFTFFRPIGTVALTEETAVVTRKELGLEFSLQQE